MIDETLKIKTYVHPVDIHENNDVYVINYLGLGRVIVTFIDDYEKIIYEYLNIMKEKKLIIDSKKRIINDRLIYDQCTIPIVDEYILIPHNTFKEIELYVKFVEPNKIVNCLREDLNIKDKISYSKYRDEQDEFIIDFKRLSKLVKGEKLDDT